MKKLLTGSLAAAFALLLSGCNAIGDKSGSLSLIYGIATCLSLLLLIGYCFIPGKKDKWFFLLFSSVLIVNIGYYLLSVSQSLSQALRANRIAYLGSVFLPMSMFMIILNVANIKCRKWLSGMLLAVGVLVFLVAASPGYLDIYYKDVSFSLINGVGILEKVYGPLHISYLIYLLGYFIVMVCTIIQSISNGKIRSTAYATILAVAVFVNMGVWLIEQLVRIDFEVLSISYIISESFLLGLHLVMMEENKPVATGQPAVDPAVQISQDSLDLFRQGLGSLTPKEKALYDCYIAGMTTAEVMKALNIKENTLKFHNKNLYSKLYVSSRKQLLEIARKLP